MTLKFSLRHIRMPPKGTLYPAALRNLCPAVTDERVAGHFLGCFEDSFDRRMLKGGVAKFKSTNSPRK